MGKYFPRSEKRPEAEGQEKFLRPREIFPYMDRPNRLIIGLFFLADQIFLKTKTLWI